ncbi:uncharacterized protein LOC110115847 [Dendrobium catenatum]|uniref:SHSP domain-containing protein n=1 Tax=Dendrobium catenatum TaxID=906689 RepID=A0A2I0X5E6_9ASPA|nr:uncharacterized protein LOC110115847 [Dendrobium catenatum]PKU83123.1 hypothetical protein MA16_Dca007781 [Dendrobium catenatum]
MGESLLSSLSMKSHHLSTALSIEPTGAGANTMCPSNENTERELLIQPRQQMALSRPAPDINLPLSAERSPPPLFWSSDAFETIDVSLGPQIYEAEATVLHLPRLCNRKCVKRGDSIWGAWFFFNYYFKPILSVKSKAKVIHDCNGFSDFEKSDLKLDAFLVQHDMENMYMWVFKERPENSLGKMQLRSYMNGHCRLGEPRFPFIADRGFVRSHRMQRKHYRGLSNPQCIHGIEVVRQPILTSVSDADQKKWIELTGRDLNFTIPLEASDFGSWRNLPSMDFELERPLLLKNSIHPNPRRPLGGSDLNLSTEPLNHDLMELSPHSNKRKKDLFPQAMDDDCCLPSNPYLERSQHMDIHPGEPSWINEFSGLMRHVYGPVTAAKTIYEDDDGYLIVVSLPFSDQQRVKVCWRNSLNHGVVKISCVSTGRTPFLKRHDRTFKLADSSAEHCPPGEFVREIPLATRIPEDANIEAYYDETGSILEIMVPKHRVGPEEHEVHVSMRPPHLDTNELMLT